MRSLATRLHRIVEKVRGAAPTADEARAIDEAIECHFVPPDSPPAWMLELLDRLLDGRTTPRAIVYPVGYPHGGNGLSNVLSDLEREVGALGIDEQGEFLAWPLPALGVRLVLGREGLPTYVVRPFGERAPTTLDPRGVQSTSRSGRCACGAVTFSADVESETYSACHCGTCRRLCGGGPFFSVRTRGVSFEGEESIARYASSAIAERGFCKACGTTLFYFLKRGSVHEMSAGVFDDAARFRLTSEIFIDEKPDGYAFAGEHPRLTGAEAMAEPG